MCAAMSLLVREGGLDLRSGELGCTLVGSNSAAAESSSVRLPSTTEGTEQSVNHNTLGLYVSRHV